MLETHAFARLACQIEGDGAQTTLDLELRTLTGAARDVRARIVPLQAREHVLLLLETPATSPSSWAPPQRSPPACRRLTRGLDHDLRSPLMAISGFAQVLDLRHRGELGPDALRCVDNILAAARRLERMADALARYGQLDAALFHCQPLDLRGLLREMAGEDPRLGLQVECEDEPLLVHGDAVVLREVFRQLFEHASGDLEGSVLHIAARADVGGLRLSLTSAACDRSLPNDSVESGAGLSFARRGLELHGGTLWIRANPGSRPALEIALPALEPPDAEHSA
ncbi:MAG: HAMP domain-containing histidine kinase [Planctomycetes bacterium]|nr:HAMP domain-containing histidine kinase [Planctomycetota bacterium]